MDRTPVVGANGADHLPSKPNWRAGRVKAEAGGAGRAPARALTRTDRQFTSHVKKNTVAHPDRCAIRPLPARGERRAHPDTARVNPIAEVGWGPRARPTKESK